MIVYGFFLSEGKPFPPTARDGFFASIMMLGPVPAAHLFGKHPSPAYPRHFYAAV
jgi:hypothetical protein